MIIRVVVIAQLSLYLFFLNARWTAFEKLCLLGKNLLPKVTR